MRGSWGILLPCISTLLVCSWSVMHLNLPAKSSTNTEKLIPYLYWCVIGIFGPELAIWAAWRQLLSARALKREIEETKVVVFINRLSKLTLGSVDSIRLFSVSWILCRHGWIRLRFQSIFRLGTRDVLDQDTTHHTHTKGSLVARLMWTSARDHVSGDRRQEQS